MPLKGMLHDDSAELRGDLPGAVCATRVHDEDFAVQPFQTLQACWQVGLLVISQNDDGEMPAGGTYRIFVHVRLATISAARSRPKNSMYCDKRNIHTGQKRPLP